MCQGYLHVICGVVDANDDLCCKTCILKHVAPATPAQEEPIAASTMLSPMPLPAIGVPGASAQTTIASIDATLAVAAVPQDKMNKGKRSASPKKPTSRKEQKLTTTDAQIGIGKRIKIKRGQLYHILATQLQRDCLPHGVPSDFNYFGTVVSGGGSKTAKKG
jgi:hypothetical protein